MGFGISGEDVPQNENRTAFPPSPGMCAMETFGARILVEHFVRGHSNFLVKSRSSANDHSSICAAKKSRTTFFGFYDRVLLSQQAKYTLLKQFFSLILL